MYKRDFKGGYKVARTGRKLEVKSQYSKCTYVELIKANRNNFKKWLARWFNRHMLHKPTDLSLILETHINVEGESGLYAVGL